MDKKRNERKKTAECAGFQVTSTCLSLVAAVSNALVRLLAEFGAAFMCVCVCAVEQRGTERV